MDIRNNSNLNSSSQSNVDVGNIGALFILGYIVGSGRWRMLAGPGTSFISSLGTMAVNHALESFRSQGLFKRSDSMSEKGSDQYSSSQSPQNSIPQSTIKPARSAY